MIGSLAPMTAPFWLGVAHLGPLTPGTIRHLDAALQAPIASRLAAVAAEQRRPVLTVHEGGRR